MAITEKSLKLLDFRIFDQADDKETSSDNESLGGRKPQIDEKRFKIQMFGINEKGETFSVLINDNQPFFYIKVENDWNTDMKVEFLNHIKMKIGRYYQDSISECKLIERNKLFGFDGGKKHKFIL